MYERIALGLKKDEGPYTREDGGEDVSFCQRARAVGYDIKVDTTLDIGHVGEVIVNADFARRNRDLYPFAWRSTWRQNPTPEAEKDPAGAQETPSDPTPEAPDPVRQAGLRVRGDELDIAQALVENFGPRLGHVLVRLDRVLAFMEHDDTAALSILVANTVGKYEAAHA